MQNDPSKDVERKRHPRFYFDDGNVVFLVENTLFNVHRYFFQRDSETFRDMFSMPPGDQGAQGLSDDNPIYLEGTECVDFERFLAILYPRNIRIHDLGTIDQCASALKLASRWHFEDICEAIGSRLRQVKAPLVEQIALAWQYDFADVLVLACFDICTRRTPLAAWEVERLGPDMSAFVAQLREGRDSMKSKFTENIVKQSLLELRKQGSHQEKNIEIIEDICFPFRRMSVPL